LSPVTEDIANNKTRNQCFCWETTKQNKNKNKNKQKKQKNKKQKNKKKHIADLAQQKTLASVLLWARKTVSSVTGLKQHRDHSPLAIK
jgi:hypothetical protein